MGDDQGTNMRSFLILVCVCAITLPGIDALTDADMRRAVAKIPGSHLRGSDFLNMVSKLNAQLRNTAGLRTQACSEFSVSELQEIQRTIYAARDSRLQSIYAESHDNRRLGA